jgi:hypothetical protein
MMIYRVSGIFVSGICSRPGAPENTKYPLRDEHIGLTIGMGIKPVHMHRLDVLRIRRKYFAQIEAFDGILPA